MLSRLRAFLCCSAFAVLAIASVVATPAVAAIGDPYDAPTLQCVAGAAGENTVDLKITAGPSGAPAGVSVQWMKYDDYVANGNAWFDSSDPRLCKLSLSGQPSLHGANETVRWELGPNAFVVITIGAINFDETGVSGHNCGLDDLDCSTTYIFRAFAHATNEHKKSAFSADELCTTDDCPVGEDCTHTQGYWKNHGPVDGECANGNPEQNPNAWPVSSLTLGPTTYTAAQLCAILNTQGEGNCVITMAHQLIAAMLNQADGADCQAAVDAVAAANALLTSKGVTDILTYVLPSTKGGARAAFCNSGFVGLNDTLDAFNNGNLDDCPDHCTSDPPDEGLKSGATPLAPTPAKKSSWGSVKKIYR